MSQSTVSGYLDGGMSDDEYVALPQNCDESVAVGDEVEACVLNATDYSSDVPARLNSDKFLLTYPRCDMPKNEVLILLSRKLDTARNHLVLCVVSEETHADGGLHLHCVCHFARRRDVNPAVSFDLEYNGRVYHPNVKVLKGAHGSSTTTASTIDNVLEYIMKQDRNPAVWGCSLDDLYCRINRSRDNRNKRKRCKEGLFDVVAKRVQSGVPIFEISSDSPGFVAQHLMKLQTFKAFHDQSVSMRKEKPITFMIGGVCIPLVPDKFQKRVHLFVYSKTPSMGKTTWFKEFLGGLNIVTCSKRVSEVKWPAKAEGADLLMLDALNTDEGNNMRGHWMSIESVCQGVMSYGVFREQVDVARRPVIITSNRTPSQVFGFGCEHDDRSRIWTKNERDSCSNCCFKKVVASRFHFIHVTRNMFMHDHSNVFPTGDEVNEYEEQVDISNID